MENQSNSSSAAPAVYAAICAVMGEIGREGIGKNRKNSGQGFQFRGIDDVYNGLNPIMARHGLVMLPRITERDCQERQTAKGGVMFYVTVKGHFDLVAAADGSMHSVEAFGEAMDSADKATNKAMSAAYKYAAFQAFCIPTEGQDDADAHTPEPVRPSRAQLQASAWSFNAKERIEAATTAAQLLEYVGSAPFTKGRGELTEDRQVRLDAFVQARLEALTPKEG